ncbi:MAG: glutamate--tRNA ligase family protein [Ilumatobacteraceae bacterium]
MADRPIRYRFAPSPTGFFHVGGVRTALFNWILAKQEGGTFVLRIEDTDAERNRPEWTQGIIDALAWFGISADDPAFEGPTFQSANEHLHLDAASRLLDAGQAYYCDCTRTPSSSAPATRTRDTTATVAIGVWRPDRVGRCGSASPRAPPWSTT